MADICIAPIIINLNDPDEGYEIFTSYLKQTEFDWEKAKEHGYKLTALAELTGDDVRVFATSALEPKQLTTEGKMPVANDIYSTMYQTLGELRRALFEQLETDMEIIGMSSTEDSDKQELTILFAKP